MMLFVAVLLTLLSASRVQACDDYLDPPDSDYADEVFKVKGDVGKNYEVIFSATDDSDKVVSRQKRGLFNGGGQDLACEMLFAIDYPLYAHLGYSIENSTELVVDLVERMNKIYKDTIFRGEFSHLYFRIREIRVLFDFCRGCNSTQRFYLQEFSKMDFSDFCLAHVFTYRDFPEGVQGLAWKKTLCHDRWNTGFTTLLNHKMTANQADAAMTMAHEIGHNLGSDHDETMGCASSYIMSEAGSSATDPQFSSCSIQAIVETLRDVLSSPRKNCFVEKPQSDPEDFSFCGDEVVEGDEECDCGLHFETCGDPCCYPAHIYPGDLKENSSAVPCRSNLKYNCLHPFASTWQFGVVGPWIMILVLTVITATALVYDWHHDRVAFTHVTQPKEMIRSETQNQISKRLARQKQEGKNVYIIQPETHRSLIRPSGRPPPPPPSAPPAPPAPHKGAPIAPSAPPGTRLVMEETARPGLVQQMKERLEKTKSGGGGQ